MSEPTLRNKRVIIADAASGMGRVLADLVVEQGASVVLLDINESSLKEAADRLGVAQSLQHGDIAHPLSTP